MLAGMCECEPERMGSEAGKAGAGAGAGTACVVDARGCVGFVCVCVGRESARFAAEGRVRKRKRKQERRDKDQKVRRSGAVGAIFRGTNRGVMVKVLHALVCLACVM